MSSKYIVKKLAEEDVPDILALCEVNPIYYKHYKSEPSTDNIKQTLKALPPNKTKKDKYFIGFYDDDSLVAILDLIVGYPNEGIAYIGWFMIHREVQGCGVGTKIMVEILSYLREKKFSYVQLAYIKGNQQAKKFWIRNRFTQIGSEIECDDYMLVKAQRKI